MPDTDASTAGYILASYIVTGLAQPVGRHADHHFGRQSCILIAHALRTLRTSPTDGYLRDYGPVHHAKPLEDRPVGTSVTYRGLIEYSIQGMVTPWAVEI